MNKETCFSRYLRLKEARLYFLLITARKEISQTETTYLIGFKKAVSESNLSLYHWEILFGYLESTTVPKIKMKSFQFPKLKQRRKRKL